jgi:hypothetical protein
VPRGGLGFEKKGGKEQKRGPAQKRVVTAGHWQAGHQWSSVAGLWSPAGRAAQSVHKQTVPLSCLPNLQFFDFYVAIFCLNS